MGQALFKFGPSGTGALVAAVAIGSGGWTGGDSEQCMPSTCGSSGAPAIVGVEGLRLLGWGPPASQTLDDLEELYNLPPRPTVSIVATQNQGNSLYQRSLRHLIQDRYILEGESDIAKKNREYLYSLCSGDDGVVRTRDEAFDNVVRTFIKEHKEIHRIKDSKVSVTSHSPSDITEYP